MAGNRGSSSADLQHSHSSNSRAPSGRISSHGRVVSKVIAADERGSSSLSSRGANNRHRSTSTRSSFSCGKHAAVTTPGSTKLNYSGASRPSSSSSNTSLALKDPQARLPPVLKNAVNCLSGSSDESGSDLDTEVAEQMVSNVLEGMDTAGWNSIASSSGSDFTSFPKGTKEGVGSSRQARRHGAGALNWGECDMPHPGRAHVTTSSRSACNGDGLPELSTVQLSHNRLVSGVSTFYASTNGVTAPLNFDSKGRFLAERIELSSMQGGHTFLAGGSSVVNQSTQFSGSAGSLENKRKTDTQAFQNPRLGLLNSQGAGYRESNMAATSSAHGAGSSRPSVSNLGCSSVADVLPSVSLTSAAGAADRLRLKNSMGSSGLINGGDVFRDSRSGKSRVGSGNSAGMVSVSDIVGGFSLDAAESQDLNMHRLNSEPARSPYQIDTRCPQRQACVELDRMVQYTDLGFPGIQSSSSSHRRRGNSPIVSRGRTNLVSLSRPIEPFLDPTAGEFSNGSSGSNTRMWSSNRNQFSGSTGVNSGISSRNRANSPLSYSTANVEEGPVTRLSFSGPPPARPPPLPPFGLASNITENAVSVPSFTTSPRLPLGSRNTGFTSLLDRDYDRPTLSSGGSAAYSPHSSQLYSLGENRPHLTVEGLSEVLSALERIEGDEDLTYEQILMLEATILLGGIGLHDRHRDMRLDVDNMSYEELLALEERIGDVNMGLTEETITKCIKRQKYAFPATTINYTPDDIEIKCSICQEEFEEAVELGMLECGHSHHVACIKQWLLQKNQCPICKASAFS